MARTALPIESVPASNADTGEVLTFTAASAVGGGNDGDKFSFTGRELVLVRNANGAAAAKTVTVESVACAHGREGDINAQSIADTKIYVLPFFKAAGWEQTDKQIYLQGEDSDIEFAVLRLPDQ